MEICGYASENLESKALNIYNLLEKFQLSNSNNNDVSFEVVCCVESFTDYLDKLHTYISNCIDEPIFINDLFNFSDIFESIEDYKYVMGFLLIYDEFLKLLEKEHLITILNYKFINYFKIEDLYNNLILYKNLELLSPASINITILRKNKLANYILSFSRCLTLSHLSKYSNNTIIELFKKKSQNINTDKTLDSISQVNNNILSISDNETFYNVPVYGQISAGLPNWAEECLEGYLPIDPNLMNIINPEECFFLRINGESMNKVIRNGAYALIRKQDIVENGDIAAVLVNGDNATIKKFTRQNELVILEPMSDDDNFKLQIYDKNTSIKILGKYIGKFEINN